MSKPFERKGDTIMKTSTMNTVRIPKLMAGMLSLTCYCFLSGNIALAKEQAPQKTAGGLSPSISRGSRGPVIWTG